jgi:hypothetical protein
MLSNLSTQLFMVSNLCLAKKAIPKLEQDDIDAGCY